MGQEQGARPQGAFLSPYTKRAGDAAPKDAEDEFEQRLELLSSVLDAVDLRSKALSQKAVAAQHDASDQSKRRASRPRQRPPLRRMRRAQRPNAAAVGCGCGRGSARADRGTSAAGAQAAEHRGEVAARAGARVAADAGGGLWAS
jgi:hypothetical protein